ncbi:cytochrome b [Paracraurococcus lichenis]|uniref:Cytochrome b/b6 domain-containing protein n=1 Tax=Paracraurococcus lichenis TaxID=3064888 RepID=A0ABT9E0A3_9PROT|nr:cytochrome b/b6 domain-containing protein [Paracraurococcus sp. LOR1-02]MDO9709599.1 cytochrome b/b6 domain-containing protein [Paracraurococcus sp. LOR1-02]
MTVMTEPLVQASTSTTPVEYSTLSKWFHWVTVTLLAVALPVGFVIDHIKDADKMPFYAIHESAGVTIFVVVLLRLVWRLVRRPPPLPEHVPAILGKVANGVHHALYALLLLQPILGFLATNAWGFPLRGETAYLGFIDFPKFMETNEDVAAGLQLFHTIGAWTILVLLVLHIGGAVFHQAIRRDGLLLRMI